MNTLSWLLYAADAMSSIKHASGAIAVISLISTGLLTVAALISGGVAVSDDDESALSFSHFAARYAKTAAVIVFVSGLVWSITPSSRTIYMIAASEAGEAVLTTPAAIDMMEDVKAIIRKRLQGELAGE